MKLCVAVLIGMVLGVATWAAPLDGTKWKVKVTPDSEAAEKGEKEFEDELIFADNTLTATACVAHGFKTSVYLVTEDDEVLKWNSIQHSEAEGVSNWMGQVKDGKMTGKLVWARRDGTKVIYTFAGERKAESPATPPKKDDRTR